MKNIEIFDVPLAIKNEFDFQDEGAEMTDWELGFLCGLIREYMPKKIVEVGVAAGGTTAVILNCISMLNINAEMYSIDINSKYYRDDAHETGYLAKRIFDKICFKHSFCLGALSTEYVEQIGKDIDFLILDTTHSLPGELLDFLVFLPYLTDGAVVVLHDIALMHLANEQNNSFATKILLDLVKADKLYQINPEYQMPTIGAFRITSKTRECAKDIFKALQMKWGYMLTENQIDSYRSFYKRIYVDDFLEDFELAVKMNQYSFNRQKLNSREKTENAIKSWIALIDKLEKKEFYIYGNGTVARELSKMLSKLELPPKKYIISDDKKILSREENIVHLSSVSKDAMILIGVSDKYKDEIYRILLAGKYENVICLDNHILNFLVG